MPGTVRRVRGRRDFARVGYPACPQPESERRCRGNHKSARMRVPSVPGSVAREGLRHRGGVPRGGSGGRRLLVASPPESIGIVFSGQSIAGLSIDDRGGPWGVCSQTVRLRGQRTRAEIDEVVKAW